MSVVLTANQLALDSNEQKIKCFVEQEKLQRFHSTVCKSIATSLVAFVEIEVNGKLTEHDYLIELKKSDEPELVYFKHFQYDVIQKLLDSTEDGKNDFKIALAMLCGNIETKQMELALYRYKSDRNKSELTELSIK